MHDRVAVGCHVGGHIPNLLVYLKSAVPTHKNSSFEPLLKGGIPQEKKAKNFSTLFAIDQSVEISWGSGSNELWQVKTVKYRIKIRMI